MVHTGERAVGDGVKRVVAAVIGMSPPGDVGHEAGGVTQPDVLCGSPARRRGVQSIRPGAEIGTVAGAARHLAIDVLAEAKSGSS